MAHGSRKKKPYVVAPSIEELRLRGIVETWGREKWPGARMVHQLPIGKHRIHMAFIGATSIAGVIVKPPKAVIHDVPARAEEALVLLPELWLVADAHHEKKFTDNRGFLPANCGLAIVEGDGFKRPTTTSNGEWETFASRDWMRLFVPMLGLLAFQELREVAHRRGVRVGALDISFDIVTRLGRALTGDQIRDEVCRALRAREWGWPEDLKPDPAIPIPMGRTAT